MSLIFDRFKTELDARSFMEQVRKIYPDAECQLSMDSMKAHDHDVFPWVQIPPVVHVDRPEDGEDEQVLEALVEDFNGVFAGTIGIVRGLTGDSASEGGN